MISTTLCLPDDINNRLNILAQPTGRSKNFYIIEAIREHLADIEDAYEGDIVDKTVFYLSPEKWEAFTKALDAPSLPNKALSELLREQAPLEK